MSIYKTETKQKIYKKINTKNNSQLKINPLPLCKSNCAIAQAKQ